ncbi:MAG: lysophospholipid acyltransferase family protein [Planctomycetes bacterium]|nr:lysophospholipid acyltransferase family protein [Planctomycetota bacterium]MCB9918989.1 lysophospholipid acyltransferase family protein [Planctomycetota bacterium]
MTDPQVEESPTALDPEIAPELAAEIAEKKLAKSRRHARLGYPILRALVATWRTEWRGREHFAFEGPDVTPAVLAAWHESLLPGSFIARDHGMAVMISKHGDGEIIANVMQRIGFQPVRGSTSRGGARALAAMLRIPLTTALVMTPDGPRGPARTCQAGTLMLASKSGRKILPTGLAASRAWHARSWDRMIVPKPFAKVVLFTGEPIDIPPGLMRDAEAVEHWRKVVTASLDDARAQAAAIVAGRA